MKWIGRKLKLAQAANGFSITEVMIAIGVFTFLTAGVIGFMVSVQEELRREKARAAVYLARHTVLTLIKSPSSWAVTVTKQKFSVFNCYENPQLPCQGTDSQGYAAFALYNSSGKVVVDMPAAKPGFNYQGASCKGADSLSGNDNCPIGISLRWKRLCANKDCENPTAQVVADFFHRPKTRSLEANFNTKALAISLEIPKFGSAFILSEDVLNHDMGKKTYASRTAAKLPTANQYVKRQWKNPCNIHTYEREFNVDINYSSTLVADASAWILQWGYKDSSYAKLMPSDYKMPGVSELQLYIGKDTSSCATDSGELASSDYPYYSEWSTSGSELTIVCSRFLEPGRYKLRLVGRVTTCVMNSAIDNDPDFRIMKLNYTLLR